MHADDPALPVRLNEEVGHEVAGKSFCLLVNITIGPWWPATSVDDEFTGVRELEVVAHRCTPAMTKPHILQRFCDPCVENASDAVGGQANSRALPATH